MLCSGFGSSPGCAICLSCRPCRAAVRAARVAALSGLPAATCVMGEAAGHASWAARSIGLASAGLRFGSSSADCDGGATSTGWTGCPRSVNRGRVMPGPGREASGTGGENCVQDARAEVRASGLSGSPAAHADGKPRRGLPCVKCKPPSPCCKENGAIGGTPGCAGAATRYGGTEPLARAGGGSRWSASAAHGRVGGADRPSPFA